MPGSHPCIRGRQRACGPTNAGGVFTCRLTRSTRRRTTNRGPTSRGQIVPTTPLEFGTEQQLRRLLDAMRQSPFEQRAVIYRAFYQGWRTGRIAQDLHITEAAVKSRLHDGLWKLRITLHRPGCDRGLTVGNA